MLWYPDLALYLIDFGPYAYDRYALSGTVVQLRMQPIFKFSNHFPEYRDALVFSYASRCEAVTVGALTSIYTCVCILVLVPVLALVLVLVLETSTRSTSF